MFHLRKARIFCKKNCPQNQKGVKLIPEFQIQFSDLESKFSEQEDITDHTLLALQVPKEIFTIKPLVIEGTYPQTLVHVLKDKYSKPIPVIAFFFYLGASLSIMREDILRDSCWIKEVGQFLIGVAPKPGLTFGDGKSTVPRSFTCGSESFDLVSYELGFLFLVCNKIC